MKKEEQNSIYNKEFEILQKSEAYSAKIDQFLLDKNISKDNVLEQYKDCVKNYKKLLKATSKITKIGDIVQKKLFNANEKISKQKEEIEQKNSELVEMQQIKLDLERKNSFLAMSVTVNHEMNQPLAVMKGYTDILERSLTSNSLTENQKKYFIKINKSFLAIEKILYKYRNFANYNIEEYSTLGNVPMVVFKDSDN